MTAHEQLAITTITHESIADVITVSDRVYREELSVCGVPEPNIIEHLEGRDKSLMAWDPQELASWLDRPADFYMRQVVMGKATTGLFIAMLSKPGFEGVKYIDTMQLDRHIRRRGIGTALINGLVLFDDPAKPICLDVNANNAPALSFYHRAGFRDTNMNEAIDIGGFPAELKLLVKEQ